MKIAILDLCIWLPEYQSGQAKFGALLADWMQRGLPEADYTVIDVVAGRAMPSPADFDGFIISGSDKGVYDQTPWMAPLRAFLLRARAAEKPLFGVCFGHQIMADVFGGKAEKVGDQQVGVRAFDVDGAQTQVHVWHQDQVTQIPPDAQVISSANYCPIAALEYSFPAMSVQFHPEYSPEYLTDFLACSRGNILPEPQTDAVIAQLAQGDVAPDTFVQKAADFFRQAV